MQNFITSIIQKSWKGLALALLATSIVACGGGGTTTGDSVTGNNVARPLPADFGSRKAVNYSPYRTSTKPSEIGSEIITKTNIREDLLLICKAGYSLIRTFDSSDKVAKQVLETIAELESAKTECATGKTFEMKVMLGIYVAPADTAAKETQEQADTRNLDELARGVALANTYENIVVTTSVGNEKLVYWQPNKMDVNTMASYIKAVRDKTTQPITTNDNWAFYAEAPKAITDVIDFAAVHTYPLLDTIHNPNLWDWKQESVPEALRATAMMDAAIASAKNEYNKVRAYLDSKGLQAMPIVIGETGWKARETKGETQRAHPVNQKMYMDRLRSWHGNGPVNIVYFQAFDEAWKESDDGWGLFNKERKARYIIKDAFPSSSWEAGTADYTDADAVYFVSATAGGVVTATNYLVFNPGALTGAAPSNATAWNAWECTPNCTAEGVIAGAGYLTITPKATQPWGWGFFNGFSDQENKTENLSLFNNGFLNFKIKTTYNSKIRIGFQTLKTDNSVVDAFMTVSPGQFGYTNDGSWKTVQVPIANIVTAAGANSPDLSKVRNAFVINDVYSTTGNAANQTTPIEIDQVYWSK